MQMKTLYDIVGWRDIELIENELKDNDVELVLRSWIQAQAKRERTEIRKAFINKGYKVLYTKDYQVIIIKRKAL